MDEEIEVETVGKGTAGDPIRPDLPEEVAWAMVEEGDGVMVVKILNPG